MTELSSGDDSAFHPWIISHPFVYVSLPSRFHLNFLCKGLVFQFQQVFFLRSILVSFSRLPCTYLHGVSSFRRLFYLLDIRNCLSINGEKCVKNVHLNLYPMESRLKFNAFHSHTDLRYAIYVRKARSIKVQSSFCTLMNGRDGDDAIQ